MEYTNTQATELFSILNGLELKPGTSLEYSTVKTLRNMKPWQAKLMEDLKDIDDDNCAKTAGGEGISQVLMKQTLKRTSEKGSVEEFQVNMYTPDGERTRKKQLRDHMAKKVTPAFKVHSTADGATLSAYHKEALADLGFYTGPRVIEQTETKEEETK